MGNIFLSALVLVLLNACSLAPFSANNTARSLGAGRASASFGHANSAYYIRAAAGVSPNVDIGYIMEFGSAFTTSGLFAKASLINNQTGPSLAVEGAYGSTETSDYKRAGLIGSLAFDESFEIFASASANFVETTEEDVEFNSPIGGMVIKKEEFSYGLAHAGFNVWFNQSMGLTLYGLQAFGEDIEWEGAISYGGGLLLNF